MIEQQYVLSEELLKQIEIASQNISCYILTEIDNNDKSYLIGQEQIM